MKKNLLYTQKHTYLTPLEPRKIYEILKQNHENAPSLYQIRQWLQSKDDYTLLKPVRYEYM